MQSKPSHECTTFKLSVLKLKTGLNFIKACIFDGSFSFNQVQLSRAVCPYQLEWRIRLVDASLKFEGAVKQTQGFKPDLIKVILMDSVERISI